MNKTVVYSAVWFGIGAGLGAIAAILILQKRVEKHYAEIANEEIKSVQDTYKLLRKQPPYDDPKTAVHAYSKRLDELAYLANGGEPIDDEDDLPDPEITQIVVAVDRNIWDTEDNPEVMTEEEMEDGALFGTRSPDHPYVISFAEFQEDETHYDKISIEYFEADNTLADDRDQIIPDVDEMIGRRNLSRFGQGSEDPNIVYIRNERIHVDFEVAYNPRGYAEIILGVETEPKHKRQIQRMREDD